MAAACLALSRLGAIPGSGAHRPRQSRPARMPRHARRHGVHLQPRAFLMTNSEGEPLTRDEEASLQRVLGMPDSMSSGSGSRPTSSPASAASSSSGSSSERSVMRAVVPPDVSHALLALLHKGSLKEKGTNLVELEGAMLAAEQAALGTLIAEDLTAAAPCPSPPAAAPHANGAAAAAPPTLAAPSAVQGVGTWQPVFASAGGFPRLLFIPVFELFDLTASRSEGRINIITELGAATTHFLGTCSWQSPGRLHYTIDSLRVDLGGKRLFTLPLPTFLHIDNDLTFFAMREGEWACARSRLGGTMLLVPEPEAGRKLVGSW